MKDFLKLDEPFVAKYTSQDMKLFKKKRQEHFMEPTENTAKLKESLESLSIQISNLKKKIKDVKSHYKQIHNEQEMLKAQLL